MMSEHAINSSNDNTIDACYSAETICQRVRQAGVVGAGGAGFPTYIKLQSQAEIFLVNAAECEPMLKVDQQLIPAQADRLIRGLLYGMTATGATEGIIALKEKYKAAITALTPLLPPQIRLHILPDVYPAGDEVITIWLATGRRVPPAALPLSIGVVVNNVQTVLNIARAVEQQWPVTRRTLTINGAVAKPCTLTVPLGVSFREILNMVGGSTIENPAFINGGPMMGALLEDLDQTITKTTGGLLVLPSDHPLIVRRKRSDKTILATALSVCEQCQMCTELCPRHLIGHELSPHLLVRAANYQQLANPNILLSALTCSECGLCENYACPVDISPMRVNRIFKNQLRAHGARYQGELQAADPMASYRMIPTARLTTRLGLDAWYHSAPFEPSCTQSIQQTLTQVTLPLRQHIGVAASPIVSIGDNVAYGQLIATVADDALGAPVHASMAGTITAITATSISIGIS